MAAATFVRRDRELEAGHEKATEQLAKHRWHWTLDKTNPNRVSFREYARQVDRRHSTIEAQAHGYAKWKTASGRRSVAAPGAPVSLFDFIEQAKLGATKAAAAEAVAGATGKTFGSVAREHREVKAVLTTAQDRAERRGTTVEEEIPRVAEWREKSRQAGRRERDDRNQSKFRLVEFEGHVGAAIRRLRSALELAREIDFDAEETAILEHSLANLRTLVGLIDVRISGETTSVDWDAEFAKAMED